jgi:WD40 repeat protein
LVAGRQIAFAGASLGQPWNILLVSHDGGAPALVDPNGDAAQDPTWSPDGNTLAAGVYHPGIAGKTYLELFDLQTHQTSRLQGSDGIFAPRWSPDGRYIVGITVDNSKLMLFDTKTTAWRQLLPADLGFLGYLSWSSDSAYLYFDTLITQNPGFHRLRISGSKLERIFDFKDIRTFQGQFGPGAWTGLAPRNVPLFVRDISLQEIYALELSTP